MKIKRFNENISKKLKKEYNSHDIEYKLIGQFDYNLPKYKGHISLSNYKTIESEVCTGDLDFVLKYYKIHDQKRLSGDIGSFDNLFILKREKIDKLLENDEIQLLLNTKKFNI